MSKVELNREQELLKKEIQSSLNQLKEDITKSNLSTKDREDLYNKMAKDAHKLHVSLPEEPKHHKYMIENRGVSPSDKMFYKHIHPVEDLLAYLEDKNANNDPEDQTIGSNFYMQIYSNRWGHKDRYNIKRIESGWSVSHLTNNGECSKSGEPFLYNALKHDNISYPVDLPTYMENLWEIANKEGLSDKKVQSHLNEISEWINLCEINRPDIEL